MVEKKGGLIPYIVMVMVVTILICWQVDADYGMKETYNTSEIIEIVIFHGNSSAGAPITSAECNITIYNSSWTAILNNTQMGDRTTGLYNHTWNHTNAGEYYVRVCCIKSDAGSCGTMKIKLISKHIHDKIDNVKSRVDLLETEAGALSKYGNLTNNVSILAKAEDLANLSSDRNVSEILNTIIGKGGSNLTTSHLIASLANISSDRNISQILSALAGLGTSNLTVADLGNLSGDQNVSDILNALLTTADLDVACINGTELNASHGEGMYNFSMVATALDSDQNATLYKIKDNIVPLNTTVVDIWNYITNGSLTDAIWSATMRNLTVWDFGERVWNLTQSIYTIPGTFGALLNKQISNITDVGMNESERVKIAYEVINYTLFQNESYFNQTSYNHSYTLNQTILDMWNKGTISEPEMW